MLSGETLSFEFKLLILFLLCSFLIIVNMYIAVILENYSQATEDVQEGITDEDYDLFYEIWQEFDPDGTQYIDYKGLSEFLDVLEPPLQIPRPNKFKIIHMDIPIVKWTNPENGKTKKQITHTSRNKQPRQDFVSHTFPRRWNNGGQGVLFWHPRRAHARLLCEERQPDRGARPCGGDQGGDENTKNLVHKKWLGSCQTWWLFYPGDNVCGSSRLRANVFVFVETTRRILRLSDTEGLEGQAKHSSFHMIPLNLINLCCWRVFAQFQFPFSRCTKTEPQVPQWARWFSFLSNSVFCLQTLSMTLTSSIAGRWACDFRRWISSGGAAKELELAPELELELACVSVCSARESVTHQYIQLCCNKCLTRRRRRRNQILWGRRPRRAQPKFWLPPQKQYSGRWPWW